MISSLATLAAVSASTCRFTPVLAAQASNQAVFAQAGSLQTPLDRLPAAERVVLRKGQVVVNGENGHYTSKVLISAPISVVWDVLTDYEAFSQFLPNVVSSRILQVSGNQKIVEQVDSRKVLVINVKSRMRTAVTETRPQRIDFRLMEGDLQQLQGYWQIQPFTLAGTPSPQVLVTQVIEAQPKASVPKMVFYGAFKGSLEKHLNAVRLEVERRSGYYSEL